MKFGLLVCILTVPFLVSCASEEDKELRAKVSMTTSPKAMEEVELDEVQLSQYKDLELKFNEVYVADLKELVETNFENQLELFRDEELGFFSGYRFMLKYIFCSKQEWADMQYQLSNRYFNNIQLEQKAAELNKSYLDDVKRLRTQFCTSEHAGKGLSVQLLELPESEIFIEGLSSHTVRNIALEIGMSGLFDSLFIFTLLLVFGVPVSEILVVIFKGGYTADEEKSRKKIKIARIVAPIICIIACFFLIHRIDKGLLDSLREQKEEFQIDYTAINQELDNNTMHFYEAFD